MTVVFIATYKDQYVQSTYIKTGTFTFQAHVLFQSDSTDGKYSISFTDEDGEVYNVNLNWQIEPNVWCEVVQTIELERPMVEFSLMASTLLLDESILIGLPHHEEGNTKSTPRAHPLDEAEVTKNEIDIVRTYISSQVDILEDRIILKVGEYQIGGKNFFRNFDGRFGTDYWGEDVELVDENGETIPVYILSVTAPNPILVYANSTPEVPETVKLVLDNGSSINVPVDWGVIDTSVLGEQSIQGIYELPEGVSGDMPEVFLGVLVTALTVVSVTPLAQVTVDQYRIPVLPTTIQLNLNDSSSVDIPVSWSSYNTNTSGTLELTAIYDLPSGITGYKPTVKLTIVVNEVVDAGTFINVIPILLSSLTIDGTSTGWLLKSDDRGNYVLTNGTSPEVTDLIQHITSTSKIYLDIAVAGAGAGFNVVVYFGSPSIRYLSDISGKQIMNLGTSSTISRISVESMATKIYRMELRNDGSVPPWF